MRSVLDGLEDHARGKCGGQMQQSSLFAPMLLIQDQIEFFALFINKRRSVKPESKFAISDSNFSRFCSGHNVRPIPRDRSFNMTTPPHKQAATLVQMLNTKGQGDYIGEPISQLAHSLQAAHLAKANNADEETTIAALLHDIGQFLPAAEVQSIAHDVKNMSSDDDQSTGGVGRVGHELIGQEYLLRLGFSPKVASLVGSHVAAKRYLCATDSSYHDTLSDASKKSLVFQGGPMQGEELQAWESNPWCDEMCQLRRWDDAAKVVGLDVKPAEAYEEMIQRHLAGRSKYDTTC